MTSLLALLQLADSGFPSGGYTLSHGFEAVVAERHAVGLAALTDLVADFLVASVAPADGAAVALAWDAVQRSALSSGHAHADGPDGTTSQRIESGIAEGVSDEVISLDEWASAMRLPEAGRNASRRCGRQLLALARATQPVDRPSPLLESLWRRVRLGEMAANHAVVFGVVAGIRGIAREETILGYLHAAALGVLGACLRLGALDHVEVQRALAGLATAMTRAAGVAATTSRDHMHGGAPLLELLAMRQERLPVRVFAS